MARLSLLLPVTALLLAPLLSATNAGRDPVALLKKADVATAAVRHIRYEARAWGEEGLLNQIPSIQASVAARRETGSKHPQIYISSTVRQPKGEEVFRQTLKSDGRELRLVSGDYVRLEPIGEGLHTARLLTASMWMREFTMQNPFRDEIEADIIRYEQTRKVGGVICDVIYVQYKGRRGEARWYFGQDDHLPRRVDRITGSGARVLELQKLTQPTELPDSLFAWTTNDREQMPAEPSSP